MVAISGHPATLHAIERSQGSVTIVDAVGRLSSTPECARATDGYASRCPRGL